MSKQEFEFPNQNEVMQIGTWLRTSKRWKKYGERDTVAWKPTGRSRLPKKMAEWLTLFLKTSRKPTNDKN